MYLFPKENILQNHVIPYFLSANWNLIMLYFCIIIFVFTKSWETSITSYICGINPEVLTSSFFSFEWSYSALEQQKTVNIYLYAVSDKKYLYKHKLRRNSKSEIE